MVRSVGERLCSTNRWSSSGMRYFWGRYTLPQVSTEQAAIFSSNLREGSPRDPNAPVVGGIAVVVQVGFEGVVECWGQIYYPVTTGLPLRIVA